MKLNLTAMLFMTLLSLSAIGTDAAEPAILAIKTDIVFAKVGDVSLAQDAFVPDGAGPFPTRILLRGAASRRGTSRPNWVAGRIERSICSSSRGRVAIRSE